MDLNHIDGTSNLFADVLSTMPCFDKIEACDYDNKIPRATFCFAMDNEIATSSPPFSLDAENISGTHLNCPYCAPLINTIKYHKNFNHKSISLHDNNKTLRTSDNKVVIPLSAVNDNRILP